MGPFLNRSRKASRKAAWVFPVAVFRVAILAIALPAPLPAQAGPRKTLSSDAQLAEAEKLLGEGRLHQAEQAVEDEIKQKPTVAGYNLLGLIEIDQKNLPGALAAFANALKLDPGSLKTHNNLANFYLADGKPELAEQQFKESLRISPANSDANYNYALFLLARGSPAPAVAHLLRVRPQTEEVRLNLVRAYLRAAKVEEGLKLASAISEGKADDVQLHFSLGVLLASEKQYKSAELELEKASALRPETFEILYNLAQAYLRGGSPSKAEPVIQRALKLEPDSAEAIYLLAQAYAEEARPVDALELLVRAHKLAPENTDVIFLMARLSMTQNFFEDAIPLLESGLKIAPRRADLRAALGESYFMSGRTEKAVSEFEELVKIDPSARSYAFLGLSYRHLGRFEEARKYFEQGLKKDPRNPACLFNVGFIEEHQGNYARAGELIEASLRGDPNFSDALLELANLRMRDKKFAEAIDLLRRYVKVSRDPASGYYKLAMAERSMHQMEAAERDLNVFQTLAKNPASGPYPFEHLFEYLDNRSRLSPGERTELDVRELTARIEKNPDQPQDLYLLAETYLKLGRVEDAEKVVAQLDRSSANDYRTQTGIGVLEARYHLYEAAVRHFQAALALNRESDDIRFDLADVYFRERRYSDALEAERSVSVPGQQDDAYLALLGDTYAHLGDGDKAGKIFQDAIARNPDNDQYYLSLGLIELRNGDLEGARAILQKGRARIPASGKILWGMGLVSVLEGHTGEAAEQLERSVELLPEWAGSYSTLGVFYYETGQIDKAREVLDRFKGSNAGGLDVGRIEDALSHAPANSAAPGAPLPVEARNELLRLALSIAERTL